MALRTREIGKSGVEATYRDEARKAGWKTLKFSSPANRGVPDRITFKGLDSAKQYVNETFYGVMIFGEHVDDEEFVREVVRRVIEFQECKAPGKDLTDKQKRVRDEFYKLGFNVVKIDGKDVARAYVHQTS